MASSTFALRLVIPSIHTRVRATKARKPPHEPPVISTGAPPHEVTVHSCAPKAARSGEIRAVAGGDADLLVDAQTPPLHEARQRLVEPALSEAERGRNDKDEGRAGAAGSLP
jgi:hypothetical protein